MNYNTDKQILGDQIGINFEPGETIKMVCRPYLKSIYLNEIRSLLLTFLFFVFIYTLFWIIAYMLKYNLDWLNMLVFLGIVTIASGSSAIRNILALRKTTYVITDLSIIIHKNLRNPSTIVINRSHIQSKESTKTFIDKHLQTGTIKIFTGNLKDNDGKTEKVYDYINSVTEPEKVFALI